MVMFRPLACGCCQGATKTCSTFASDAPLLPDAIRQCLSSHLSTIGFQAVLCQKVLCKPMCSCICRFRFTSLLLLSLHWRVSCTTTSNQLAISLTCKDGNRSAVAHCNARVAGPRLIALSESSTPHEECRDCGTVPPTCYCTCTLGRALAEPHTVAIVGFVQHQVIYCCHHSAIISLDGHHRSISALG